MHTIIDKIIDFSVKNKFWVLLLTLLSFIGGILAIQHTKVDAIPDLSDTQVIIYTKWDRSPDIIEDQVTFPLINALLGAPKVKDIRGFSDFGYSYVYVLFEEGTDVYWARSRVLEYLSKISSDLPKGAKSSLGPDATGVGWVFQYALSDKTGKHSHAELRSLQDWFLRFVLGSTPGVAEVAPLGGYQKQYQVKINPRALETYRLPLSKIVKAISDSNNEIGARVVEISGAEYMVRGRGYIKNLHDLEQVVVSTNAQGTPIYLKNVAQISFGPEMRRGVSDLDGEGNSVGGIVVIRYGENPLTVIDAVKAKLEDIKKSLPPGVEIVTTYDRSTLIKNTINTLISELRLEMIVVALIIFLFLLHIPSAMIPVITLPVAVVLTFIPLYYLDISSNIMSLGGIAIAIGAMVDAAIVVVENTHKHLHEWKEKGKPGGPDPTPIIVAAIKEVAPASFYSLLVIAVSFLPIFVLEGQEGKLFKPLALTKNLSMIIAAFLAITLDPALRVWLTTLSLGKIGKMGENITEENHPITKYLHRLYGPVVNFAVDKRKWVLSGAFLLLLVTIPLFIRLGSEFMPPLNEGSILYMPTTMPGISVGEAEKLLITQDKILKSFPEVEHVYGKAGRADTATDPAPLSMMETVITLKDQRTWRYKTYDELIAALDEALKIPGTTNAWTMPIRNRIDMLSTGIRTPVGIKILGNNIQDLEKIGIEIEKILNPLHGVRNVFAERTGGGYFLDFYFNREKMARYGLNVGEAQQVLLSAVGGETVSTTIEGRERYSINVRYAPDYRQNLDALKRILLETPSGALIPIGDVAQLKLSEGPSMIRNENGLLASYVYIDLDTAKTDLGHFVEKAHQLVSEKIKLPSNVTLVWSGQYENMQRVAQKMKFIIPLTLLLIVFLLYFNMRSWVKTSIVMLAVPFSAIGAIILLSLLGYNMSIAVWVGLIALMGVDAETGIFMLLYLDLSFEKAKREGRMQNFADLKEAIHQGAVKRIRPKVMTVATLLIALLPIMLTSSMHAGADVMKRIAAPMVGGIMSSFALELLVYPAIYAYWKKRENKL